MNTLPFTAVRKERKRNIQLLQVDVTEHRATRCCFCSLVPVSISPWREYKYTTTTAVGSFCTNAGYTGNLVCLATHIWVTWYTGVNPWRCWRAECWNYHRLYMFYVLHENIYVENISRYELCGARYKHYILWANSIRRVLNAGVMRLCILLHCRCVLLLHLNLLDKFRVQWCMCASESFPYLYTRKKNIKMRRCFVVQVVKSCSKAPFLFSHCVLDSSDWICFSLFIFFSGRKMFRADISYYM